VHAALYRMFVLEGLSAEVVATKVNMEFRIRETRGSVLGYAWRQGWEKGNAQPVSLAPPKPIVRPPAPKIGKGPLSELALMPPPAPAPRLPTSSKGPPPRPTPMPRKPELGLAALEAEPVYGKPAVLAELHATQCKFPVPRGKVWPKGEMHLQLFCGAKKLEGEPYCLTHFRKAYPTGKKT
jgi:hypothetical protein